MVRVIQSTSSRPLKVSDNGPQAELSLSFVPRHSLYPPLFVRGILLGFLAAAILVFILDAKSHGWMTSILPSNGLRACVPVPTTVFASTVVTMSPTAPSSTLILQPETLLSDVCIIAREIINTSYNRCATNEDGRSNDVAEHLPYLLNYSQSFSPKRVTEIGVRNGVTSWAFAKYAVDVAAVGQPVSELVTYRALDVTRQAGIAALEDAMSQCSAVTFSYTLADDLVIAPWESDLLFIDTWHTYAQLVLELARWAPLTTHTIFMHDTVLFRDQDEEPAGNGQRPVDVTLYVGADGEKRGLNAAIQDFLKTTEGLKWSIFVERQESNGLTGLLRKPA